MHGLFLIVSCKDRYFVIFLRNSQSMFLPTKDKKWDRNLTIFILILSHSFTSRFTAAFLTAYPSIIIHWHTDIYNPNISMNSSSEAEVYSPSGNSSYILQPEINSITLHLSSLVIQILITLVQKMYGESSTVIPNSLPCLSKYFFILDVKSLCIFLK